MNRYLELMKELNEEASYPTGFEEAIIGIIYRHDTNYIFLMSTEKILDILVNQGMSYLGAIEYFEFNLKYAYYEFNGPYYLELTEIMG